MPALLNSFNGNQSDMHMVVDSCRRSWSQEVPTQSISHTVLPSPAFSLVKPLFNVFAFFFCFLFCFCFEVRFYSAVQAYRNLNMWSRLALNSEHSMCLSLELKNILMNILITHSNIVVSKLSALNNKPIMC